jgi:short-subunit dehydrogenase involved in D-alanine esterification of teichoic acids
VELQGLGKFTPFLADFDTAEAPKKLSDFVRGKWDSVDFLLNNAAIQTYKNDWHDEGLELLNEQWRCNVFAQHELIFRMQDLLKKELNLE